VPAYSADVLHPGSSLREELRELAWSVRFPRPHSRTRADVEMVARRLGIEVRIRDLGPVEGVAVGDSLVAATGSPRTARTRFVLAHELAHVLIQRKVLVVPTQVEEWVCDWFARDLLAPIRLIDAHPRLAEDEVGRRFSIPTNEAEAQLTAWAVMRGVGASGSEPMATFGTRPHRNDEPLTMPLCDGWRNAKPYG